MSRNPGKLFALISIFLLCLGTTVFAADICPTPSEGDQCTFNAHSFEISGAPEVVSITATCRKTHDDVYIFVDDAAWSSNKVTQQEIDNLLLSVTSSTPSSSFSDGILPELETIFNGLPDKDNDDHIWIVIHDVQPDAKGITSYYREIDLEYYHDEPVDGSNGHEIIFIDSKDVDQDERLSDLAYQMVDMIHIYTDPNEEGWIRDVIARQFPINLGYTEYKKDISGFALSPSQSLLGDVVSADYTKIYFGATALFGIYLTEQYGPYFFDYWLTSNLTGRLGFTEAMEGVGDTTSTFCSHLHDWAVINGVGRGDYSYQTYDPPSFSNAIIQTFPQQLTPALDSYSASYVSVLTSSIAADEQLQLSIEFPDEDNIQLTVAKYLTTDVNALEVSEQPIMAGQPTIILFDDLHGNYDRVLLTLSRCKSSDPMQYTVKAEIIAPQPDGDTDTAEDGDTEETDGDEEPTDGDSDTVTTDGDEEPTVDGDESEYEDVVFGTKNCTEVNDCQNNCKTQSCITACLEEGTGEAQQQWGTFYSCMTGDFAGGLNCLDIPTLETRNACIQGQCPDDIYEACKLSENVVITKDDIGGSNCNNISDKYYSSLLLALLALTLFVSRRKNNQSA